ncbi:MAG: hydroxyisourate hydrolase [Pseudomonadota bacterium]|jgi:5-hydroxyisourate hydrolase
MSRLTTHVLDTAHGCPAGGMALALFRIVGDRREPIVATRTNADGRCDRPLLSGDTMVAGVYELVFQVAEYFAARGTPQADPPFIGEAVIRFGLAHPDQHYHVPLLVSPWSYSTYRGS